MKTLAPRDRRVLAIGTAVVAVALLLGKGAPAWQEWDAELRATLQERTGELARSQAEIRALPALRDSGAARRTRLIALAPRIVGGDTRSEAEATLAGLLASTASSAEVQLGVVSLQADSAVEEAFVPVRAEADVTGTLRGLLRMLALLEGGPELLRIPRWSITQPQPTGPSAQPEMLRLDLIVEGLAAPENEGGA